MLQTTPDGLLLDGRPFRLLSGAVHYFRSRPEQWPQRLRMLRAMGLNAVETYVPWNLHEPRPGTYDFTGIADLGRFLDLAAEAGLHTVVRPSPYICAEWENGGLPWWLLSDRQLHPRTSDPRYLALVDRWYDRLIPLLAERQHGRGGSILAVQIENEYGSFGTDRAYLAHLAEGLRARGIEVPLFTSDGPDDFFLTGGTLPGHLATVNFGSRAGEAFAALRAHRPQDPPVCMEFWNGWFDHWGDAEHTTRPAEDAAAALREILAEGGSVNLYMAHGGTNFGTWAGANTADPATGRGYQPTTTSYDYDAPIDERGAPTAKFHAFREVLAEYADGPLPEPEPLPPLLAATAVTLTRTLSLAAALPALTTGPVGAPVPPSFEELGLEHGLVRYRTTVPGPRRAHPLTVAGLADRAHVSVDGQPLGTLERDADGPALAFAVPGDSAELTLLVESMGRVNYGAGLGDRKGLTAVLHERQQLHGWTADPVPLRDGTPDALPWHAATPAQDEPAEDEPAFHQGWFEVAEPADSHLWLPGWTKGYAWVNGVLLGRYWSRGPQQALYVPWPLLRPGRNELVLLELDARPGGPRSAELRPQAG